MRRALFLRQYIYKIYFFSVSTRYVPSLMYTDINSNETQAPRVKNNKMVHTHA